MGPVLLLNLILKITGDGAAGPRKVKLTAMPGDSSAKMKSF